MFYGRPKLWIIFWNTGTAQCHGDQIRDIWGSFKAYTTTVVVIPVLCSLANTIGQLTNPLQVKKSDTVQNRLCTHPHTVSRQHILCTGCLEIFTVHCTWLAMLPYCLNASKMISLVICVCSMLVTSIVLIWPILWHTTPIFVYLF